MNIVSDIPRRHKWQFSRTIHACESNDGCERTERVCSNPHCGLVMITVHPPHGRAYRKWRHPNGNEFTLGATPPCLVHARPELVGEVQFQ